MEQPRLKEYKKHKPNEYKSGIADLYSTHFNLYYFQKKYDNVNIWTGWEKLVDVKKDEKVYLYSVLPHPFNMGMTWFPSSRTYGAKNSGYYMCMGYEGIASLVKFIKYSKRRFIFVPLALTCHDCNAGHANFILIDKKLKIIEKFDPNGEPEDYDNGLERDKLNNIFELIVKIINNTLDTKYVYMSPINVCPAIKYPQYMTSITNHDEGMCATWVYFYLDYRLQNPDYTPKEVLEALFNKFKGKEDELYQNLLRFQTKMFKFRGIAINELINYVKGEIDNDIDSKLSWGNIDDNDDNPVGTLKYRLLDAENYPHINYNEFIKSIISLKLYSKAYDLREYHIVDKIQDAFSRNHYLLQMFALFINTNNRVKRHGSLVSESKFTYLTSVKSILKQYHDTREIVKYVLNRNSYKYYPDDLESTDSSDKANETDETNETDSSNETD